jgi:hypothetical protein
LAPELIAYYVKELLCEENFSPKTLQAWTGVMDLLCPSFGEEKTRGNLAAPSNSDLRRFEEESIDRFESLWDGRDLYSKVHEIECRLASAFHLRDEDAGILSLAVAMKDCGNLQTIVLFGGHSEALRRIALLTKLTIGVVAGVIGAGSTLSRTCLLNLDLESPSMYIDNGALIVAQCSSIAELKDYFAPLATDDGYVPDPTAAESLEPMAVEAISTILRSNIPGNSLIISGEGIGRAISALLSLGVAVGRPFRLARRPYREFGEPSPVLFGLTAAATAEDDCALLVEGLPSEMGAHGNLTDIDGERSAFLSTPPCPVFWVVSDPDCLPRGVERYFYYSAKLSDGKKQMDQDLRLKIEKIDPNALHVVSELVRGRERLRGRGNSQESRIPSRYDPDSLRTDIALDDLIESLKKRGMNKPTTGVGILFWGPPGTGKTAFAAHLAERIGAGFSASAVSDFLRPFAGEGERAVCEAFAHAESRGDVLLVDEADSVLRKRAYARTSWEVSLTNEILMRMDGYHGIVIACTNRLSDLDPAVLRRFAWKVEFKPLDLTGAQRLLHLYFPDMVNPEALAKLDALHGLVPGDFEAIRRRLEFSNTCPDGSDIVDQLAIELKYRDNEKPKIGFGY